MGKGRDLARPHGPVHAQVLDDFMDQLVIALLKRLADGDGNFEIPIAEIDATGSHIVSFSINNGNFHFEVRKKQ